MSALVDYFDTPQAAYDWAQTYFRGRTFGIIGSDPIFPRWYLMSPGGQCMLALPKGRPAC